MIGLIVARSKNNVIGKNGNIPWKIKGEQKQFRELTTVMWLLWGESLMKKSVIRCLIE